MTHRTLLTATLAGLVLSGAALAQMQAPTQTPTAPQAQTPPAQMPSGSPTQAQTPSATQPAPMAPTERLGRQPMPGDQQANAPMHRPMGKGQMNPSDRVPKDRFGNVVRGNTCAAHWANCAYDPSNPKHQQLGAAPMDDGQRMPTDGRQPMSGPRTGF
jgi:hypothetical protein